MREYVSTYAIKKKESAAYADLLASNAASSGGALPCSWPAGSVRLVISMPARKPPQLLKPLGGVRSVHKKAGGAYFPFLADRALAG